MLRTIEELEALELACEELSVKERIEKFNEFLPEQSTFNGYCYKADITSFSEAKDNEIIYVPESAYTEGTFEYYTKEDFYNLVDSDLLNLEETAWEVFETVNWQHPESYYYELCEAIENEPEYYEHLIKKTA
ncbi:hypothetical protein OFO01_07325 [Campylobacter sp. JMF_01 NE2]|uniref:hypothetical protein n=1 Tax=unclassified Campylobacter TaxID=2593542 RepID=UPI0022E9DCFA|nr:MULTISPECIES: hypothetical protein [unclassified Campylobacter]MDA3053225.1 hypothetical protein [Campylobacter sp. JMF_03 NE3]MDA3067592.1 hypothetical protein [Campylobacter sp. JMF_01 NE2]